MQGNEKLNECGKIRPCEKKYFVCFEILLFTRKGRKEGVEQNYENF